MDSRRLIFRIFRHNPYDPDSTPRLQGFNLDETPRMTLFTALTRIREELDPSLQFDFVCRSAVCGSCAVMVNGRPRLACRTRTAELPKRITLMPLPFFRLVADLSVDTGSWFRGMGERVESWIHSQEPFDPDRPEERMSNEQAQAVYELDRCIECGCCLASCGAAQMRADYLGAAGLLRIARFLADPRDHRSPAQVFEVVATDEGVFGCVGFLACQDYCPKGLPLAAQIAHLRRKLTLASLKSNGHTRQASKPLAPAVLPGGEY
ncbi:MAG: fumarate reductase iron-sulfur subunit [Chloroflexi bacterium]|nr:fumarate reductase iron-sulfur subunit [Chloroflexota bacterium]